MWHQHVVVELSWVELKSLFNISREKHHFLYSALRLWPEFWTRGDLNSPRLQTSDLLNPSVCRRPNSDILFTILAFSWLAAYHFNQSETTISQWWVSEHAQYVFPTPPSFSVSNYRLLCAKCVWGGFMDHYDLQGHMTDRANWASTDASELTC